MSPVDLTIVIALATGVVRLSESAINLVISAVRKRNGKNGYTGDLQALHYYLERTEKLHEQTAEKMASIATDQARIADAMLRVERQIDRLI